MKLFKKVLAVVLVGAMAVSMLTACGDSTKTADIKNALKDVGVTTTKTMNKETSKAMDELQSATASIANGTATAEEAAAEVAKMTEYSFAHTASGNLGTWEQALVTVVYMTFTSGPTAQMASRAVETTRIFTELTLST